MDEQHSLCVPSCDNDAESTPAVDRCCPISCTSLLYDGRLTSVNSFPHLCRVTLQVGATAWEYIIVVAAQLEVSCGESCQGSAIQMSTAHFPPLTSAAFSPQVYVAERWRQACTRWHPAVYALLEGSLFECDPFI